MKLEIEIHPIQSEILKNLLFSSGSKFSELNTTKIDSNHFNFHLKRLLDVGLVEKNNKDLHKLTISGKEFANRFDTEKKEIEKQAKISVRIVASRKNKNKTEYLFQKRLKHPFFGYLDFVGGKVRWGEDITEAAARELMEEAGLEADLEVMGMMHKIDYKEDREILGDVYFITVKATNVRGDLLEIFEGGQNLWMTLDEALSRSDYFHGLEILVQLANKEREWLCEDHYDYESHQY